VKEIKAFLEELGDQVAKIYQKVVTNAQSRIVIKRKSHNKLLKRSRTRIVIHKLKGYRVNL
jgi:hypothetical protein